MKFAVVEYTSKSGKIWRHSAQRPNYLCDPVEEIDPTSFGCYVSVLDGEHIPLKLFASENGSVWRKIVKRITGSWPPHYPLTYFLQFDVLLVVHQLSDTHELTAFVRRIKKEKPEILILGVPTQPYGLLQAATAENPDVRQHLADFINSCDVFISIVKDTVNWYEEVADVPVVYVPQPYPAEFAARSFVPRGQKDATILVAGVTQRDNIRQGQVIATQLQKKFPEYTILVPKIEDTEYDVSNVANARFEVFPFEKWQNHLKTLANTYLVINTDYTKTRGRVQTDCAAVGTPSVGGNSDATLDLFPELASTPDTPVDELVAIGSRLLSDNAYYDAVVSRASVELKKYDYEQSAARIRELVKKYR